METIHLLVRHVEAARGLDERDGNGRTALHHAAMGGLEAVVNLMLSEGAQANIEDDIGMTPLMLACQLNRVGIARTLVRHMRGQGLEKRDGNGRTALHYATVGGLEEVANLMLSEGAQANIEDANGMTPLMLACRSGHLRIAQRLVRHMRGQGLQNRDLGGNTALHYAAVCGRELHWEAVCRSRGVRGLYELPLPTFGCTFGRSFYTKAVRVLLLAGADATLTNNEGQTPRQVAELEGIADTVAVFNVSTHACCHNSHA
jgi:ankyrin repeat protein